MFWSTVCCRPIRIPCISFAMMAGPWTCRFGSAHSYSNETNVRCNGTEFGHSCEFCLSLVLRFWRLADRDLPGTSECCDSVSWSLDAKPIKTWFGKCLENLLEMPESLGHVDVAVWCWFVFWSLEAERFPDFLPRARQGVAWSSLFQWIEWDMTIITARICMLCWLSINVWLLLAVVDWFFFTMLRYSPFCIRSLARV